jgi:hypothetical protein
VRLYINDQPFVSHGGSGPRRRLQAALTASLFYRAGLFAEELMPDARDDAGLSRTNCRSYCNDLIVDDSITPAVGQITHLVDGLDIRGDQSVTRS